MGTMVSKVNFSLRVRWSRKVPYPHEELLLLCMPDCKLRLELRHMYLDCKDSKSFASKEHVALHASTLTATMVTHKQSRKMSDYHDMVASKHAGPLLVTVTWTHVIVLA